MTEFSGLKVAARDERQELIALWCRESFGDEQSSSVPHRAVRMLEEAIELAQAAGVAPAMAHRLVDYVFGRAVGELGQELGGLGVTMLALAAAAGRSAEEEEVKEVQRVLGKPRDHFRARNDAKNAAGLDGTKPMEEGREAGFELGEVDHHGELLDRQAAELREARKQLELFVGQRFKELSGLWRQETGHLSNPHKWVEHPAYQAIVKLGWPVVPFLLGELVERPTSGARR